MNKTKLEVIRINEDVIATSGQLEFCSNHNLHYYFAGNVTESGGDYRPSDTDNSHSYYYLVDKWVDWGLASVTTTYFDSQPASNTYYVLNGSGKTEICTKSHYPETVK